MDPFEAIRKERKTGTVYCGTTKDAKGVVALATAFGLKGDASLYHQVDAAEAREILVAILHRDLAHGNRQLSQARAEALAGQVLERFADPGIRFLTNAKFKQVAGALVLSHWDPATTSTFDTGLLFLGTGESGCVWVSEDD